ncbi:hypothetical protein [Cellulosimicrobium marinum]|uniref:hypothetical protein n=1 Tax=Cellulosimicrobium marinum TaxID=1638992 RepID=UPI001E458074|nr:hypothetical protein [Cellulosimicrobium marinum]MCB7137579.1 hypothetical protein [Cellulosimicrobium marinum]
MPRGDGPAGPVEDAPPHDPDLALIVRSEQRLPRALAVGLGALGCAAAVTAAVVPGAARWAAAFFAVLLLAAAVGAVVALLRVRRRWAPAVGTVPVARWTGTGRGSPETTSRETVVELAAELVPVPAARFLHVALAHPRAVRGPATVEVFRLAPDGRSGGPVRVAWGGRVAWGATAVLSDESRPARRAPRKVTPDLSPH